MNEFERAVAQAKMHSFLLFEDDSAAKPAKPRKEHKLVKLARRLTPDQLQQLVGLLDGSSALVTLVGESYTVAKEGDGYRVQATGAGSPSHFVTKGTCSCEDHRFRGRSCKHMELVRRFL